MATEFTPDAVLPLLEPLEMLVPNGTDLGTFFANTSLAPTHDCFNDAMEFLEVRARDGTIRHVNAPFHLVHGVIMPDGVEASHAWVEEADTFAWNAVLMSGKRVYLKFRLWQFLRAYRVLERDRYGLSEVYELNRKYENYGPWRLRYLKLCRNYDPAGNQERRKDYPP